MTVHMHFAAAALRQETHQRPVLHIVVSAVPGGIQAPWRNCEKVRSGIQNGHLYG